MSEINQFHPKYAPYKCENAYQIHVFCRLSLTIKGFFIFVRILIMKGHFPSRKKMQNKDGKNMKTGEVIVEKYEIIGYNKKEEY